jgi:uncharacterized iron-regulated protein
MTMMLVLAATAALPVAADELDVLPIGDPSLATSLASTPPGTFFDCREDRALELEELASELVRARVVLVGEAHTDLQQKLFHADLLAAMAELEPELVLGMEFFQRSDQEALDAWSRGELDESQLLEATEWIDRGTYNFGYYRPVMEVARDRGIRVVGLNVPREIVRAVNRGGLESLSDVQQAEIGEVTTDGSPEHRYLIERYFGETAAMLPPGWFDNMYAAQCVWDVAMARSILANLGDGETMVVIVGSGHVAYDLGISRRIRDEVAGTDRADLTTVTFAPVTAPPPDPEGDPHGHPVGGHGMGMAADKPARFTRSLSHYVGAFEDTGGIEAYPRVGLRLKEDDKGVQVSMAWPDTPADGAGFESGDRILDLNGTTYDDLSSLRKALEGIQWSERLGFRIRRGDDEREIAVLLFPQVDRAEEEVAPGWAVEPLATFDPVNGRVDESAVDNAPQRVVLVSRDGAPSWVEVRSGDSLDETHELDSDGRVVRSLFRTALEDGTVELRYERDEAGEVVTALRYDRAGTMISE